MCGLCDGQLELLGTLGCVVHCRCRHCGADQSFHTEIDVDELSEELEFDPEPFEDDEQFDF